MPGVWLRVKVLVTPLTAVDRAVGKGVRLTLIRPASVQLGLMTVLLLITFIVNVLSELTRQSAIFRVEFFNCL